MLTRRQFCVGLIGLAYEAVEPHVLRALDRQTQLEDLVDSRYIKHVKYFDTPKVLESELLRTGLYGYKIEFANAYLLELESDYHAMNYEQRLRRIHSFLKEPRYQELYRIKNVEETNVGW